MHKDGKYLDGQYASFGKVVDGIEIVDRICNISTSPSDRPYQSVIINSIEVIDEPELEVNKI